MREVVKVIRGNQLVLFQGPVYVMGLLLGTKWRAIYGFSAGTRSGLRFKRKTWAFSFISNMK